MLNWRNRANSAITFFMWFDLSVSLHSLVSQSLLRTVELHATRATPSLPKFCINVSILFYIHGFTVPCDRCLDRLLKKFGNSGKSALRVFRMWIQREFMHAEYIHKNPENGNLWYCLLLLCHRGKVSILFLLRTVCNQHFETSKVPFFKCPSLSALCCVLMLYSGSMNTRTLLAVLVGVVRKRLFLFL